MTDEYTRERRAAFNARWNTGDGTPHSNYILAMFRYANRRTDVDVVAMYVDRLSHIPLTHLQICWEDVLKERARADAGLPSIEAILSRYAIRKRAQQEKREEANKHKKEQAPAGEKLTAWEATRGAFIHQFLPIVTRTDMRPPRNQYVAKCWVGGQVVHIEDFETQYTGSFPYDQVASIVIADIDREEDMTELRFHAQQMAKLKALFEEEWGAYAR